MRSDPAAASKIAGYSTAPASRCLTADSTSEDREIALRKLATVAVTLDALGRAILREAAIGCLGSIGVNSPARLVDAALALVADEPAADTLEAPKPWEDVVDGASLLFALASTLERYVVLPDGSAVALALWIVHTYALDAAAISPIIAIVSPTRRCGKSTLLDVLGALVLRPMAASNVSAAAVYRSVERWRPTLLLDELDTYIHDADELRGVINSSHRRSQAYVARCEERAGEIVPVRYSTWCARALACIGRLPGTLEDRSIILRLRRRASTETVARYRHDRTPGELEPLRRQARTVGGGTLKPLFVPRIQRCPRSYTIAKPIPGAHCLPLQRLLADAGRRSPEMQLWRSRIPGLPVTRRTGSSCSGISALSLQCAPCRESRPMTSSAT